MDKVHFKEWLISQGCDNAHLLRDTLSRAKRVELAFKAIDPDFSYEREYLRDGGVSFVKLISRRGITIKEPIALPIGTNQMDSIANSAKKYMQFLCKQENRRDDR